MATTDPAAHGWTTARLAALVWRLLADLAQARGLTVEQAALHYSLPDRPPLIHD